MPSVEGHDHLHSQVSASALLLQPGQHTHRTSLFLRIRFSFGEAWNNVMKSPMFSDAFSNASTALSSFFTSSSLEKSTEAAVPMRRDMLDRAFLVKDIAVPVPALLLLACW